MLIIPAKVVKMDMFSTMELAINAWQADVKLAKQPIWIHVLHVSMAYICLLILIKQLIATSALIVVLNVEQMDKNAQNVSLDIIWKVMAVVIYLYIAQLLIVMVHVRNANMPSENLKMEAVSLALIFMEDMFVEKMQVQNVLVWLSNLSALSCFFWLICNDRWKI